MKIRVGFEMIYDCPQPTPMVFNLNVHFTGRPISSVATIWYSTRRSRWRPIATASATGALASSRRRAERASSPTQYVNDSGLPDVIVPQAQQHAVQDLPEETSAVPAGKPLLRNRSTVGNGMESVRQCADRMGPRPGDLRLRAQPYRFRVRTCAHDPDGARGLSRQDRRLPRLRASGRSVLSMHEHPGAVLHRLSGRHRHAAAVWPDGFRGMVRGVSRRPLVHVRSAQQHPAYRQGPHCAGPRRSRRRAQQRVWPNILASFKVWTDEVS